MGRVGALVCFFALALVGCDRRCPDGQHRDKGRCVGAQGEQANAIAEEPGFLVVICEPACDEVVDNGRVLGPSPVLRVPVQPGAHKIALRSGAVQREIQRQVVSGQTTAERVPMVAP